MPENGSKQLVLSKQRLPVVVELANVPQREMRWLWPGKIPLGKLTLLAGDPELGKSFLTIDMAARVTSGSAWPDGTPSVPGSVIFLNAEDELADTVCPRLHQAGAELSKCAALAAVRSEADGLAQPLSLARDLRAVRETLLTRPDCRLIVIDPISAYMGYVDSNSNTDVRTLLFPLSQLAAEFDVAIVVVTHFNKKGSGRTIYRAMGSLAFVAASRSAWVLVRDPEDEGRRIFLPLKSNLSDKSAGMAFRLQAPTGAAVAKIDWESEAVIESADQLLCVSGAFNKAAQTYRDEESYALKRLREALTEGPVEQKWLFSLFRPPCVSDPQLYRAADKLGVIKMKESYSNTSWVWALPEHREVLLERIAKAQSERDAASKSKKRRRIAS